MKSKQTKTKEISRETKQIVLQRQHYKSISGVALTEQSAVFHHVVFRGNQGVGYEFNIVALTWEEHRRFHDGLSIFVNGKERYSNQEFNTLMKNHLKLNYNGWTEDKCKYKKYFDEKDYGITRKE